MTHVYHIIALFQKIGIIRVWCRRNWRYKWDCCNFFIKKWDFLSHDLMGGGVICIKPGVWKTKY